MESVATITKQGPVAHWLGSWAGTMQGPVPPCLSSRAGIMQGPVVHLACLGSACGHHARPRGTRHGMGGGTCHVSLVKRPSFYAFAKFLRDDMTWARGWGGSRPAEASKGRGDIAGGWRGWVQTSGPWHLGLARGRAPCKAPCHLGLARGRAPCKASCHLGLARGHQARPHGTRRVSWLGSRAGTKQGLVPPWLGSRAPSKAPWHVSRVLAWLTGGHHARPRATLAWLAGTKQGPVAPWLGSREGTMQGPVPPWLGSRAPSKAPWHLSLARRRAPCKASCHLGLARWHQYVLRNILFIIIIHVCIII